MSKKDIRNQLVRLLADGHFHSGEALGKYLGVSRNAIAKHIQTLSELGLDIFKVMGKGYKLSQPLLLLDADTITAHTKGHSKIEVLNIIDSTNQYLKDNIGELSQGHICLAEAQTAGRGRHGRKWVSPFGSSLYLSMFWRFNDGYQAAAGLSLAIGVAIARALKSFAEIQVYLKWPNDVYLDNKKLAGVLIEVEGQFGAACNCIIGIGLNVRLPEELPDIGQPYTDLAATTSEPIDRNRLAGVLINELHSALTEFEQNGLTQFIADWRSLDLYANKPVRLMSGNSETTGVSRGINESGGLLIESEEQTKVYYGGEVSVRAVN